MAPFNLSDHSVSNSDPKVVQAYLDYGAIVNALRGRVWVLTAHLVNVSVHEQSHRARRTTGQVPSLVPCNDTDPQQQWHRHGGADGTALECAARPGECLVVYSPNFTPTHCQASGGEVAWM